MWYEKNLCNLNPTHSQCLLNCWLLLSEIKKVNLLQWSEKTSLVLWSLNWQRRKRPKAGTVYSPAALILTKSAELEPECPENKGKCHLVEKLNISTDQKSQKTLNIWKTSKRHQSERNVFLQFWSVCCQWAAGRCNCPLCCTAAGWPSGRWRPAVCTCKQQQQQVQNETESNCMTWSSQLLTSTRIWQTGWRRRRRNLQIS